MSDTSDGPTFGKFPAAAAFDRRLRGFDLQILLAMCLRADFRTMVTDHSGVQLSQDFNVARPAVVRAVARLVTYGYLTSLGRNRRHAHRFQVNLDTALPVPRVAHVAPVVHETPVAQSGVSTCTTGGTLPVPPVVHSSESLSDKDKNKKDERPGALAPEVDYWSALLVEADFEPGSKLVQAARDIGFARDDGGAKDALQAQRRAFFAHRTGRGYIGTPTRREFYFWLQEAAKRRAAAPPPPEKKSRTSEPPKPAAPRRINAVAGVPEEWRAAWRQTLDTMAASDAIINERFHLAVLEQGNGGAVIRMPGDFIANMCRDSHGKHLQRVWRALLPNVSVQIAAPRPKRAGSARLAAE